MRNWQNKIVSPASTKALRGAIPNILLPHLFSPLKEKIVQGREMFSPLDALLQKRQILGTLVDLSVAVWVAVGVRLNALSGSVQCGRGAVNTRISASQSYSATKGTECHSATNMYIRANDGGQPQGANQWRHHVVSTEILGQSLYDQFNLNSSQQVNQMNILMVKKFRQMNFEENWKIFESVHCSVLIILEEGLTFCLHTWVVRLAGRHCACAYSTMAGLVLPLFQFVESLLALF